MTHDYGFPVTATIRVPLPEPAQMTPEQLAIHSAMVKGPRGRMVGPMRAVVHSPELADRWQKFGELVRYRMVLPEELKELAILACGRHWNSDVEWAVHRTAANKAGVSADTIAAIEAARPVRFARLEHREVYEFTRLLLRHGQVPDDAYAAIRSRWGDRGVVELTAIVGYYSMVAMMVNVHLVPVPAEDGPGIHPLGSNRTELAESELTV